MWQYSVLQVPEVQYYSRIHIESYVYTQLVCGIVHDRWRVEAVYDRKHSSDMTVQLPVVLPVLVVARERIDCELLTPDFLTPDSRLIRLTRAARTLQDKYK
jgi:hypothetical protein